MSDPLWPHGLQHSRLPHPSLSPGVCSDSCPLSQWCHPTISSSAAVFSFCLHISQHQGLLQWIGSLHQEAKVLYTCILSRFSCVQLFATLWTASHQAPPSTGFSRQEYWSGLPFPSLKVLYTLHLFIIWISSSLKWLSLRLQGPQIKISSWSCIFLPHSLHVVW